MPTRIQARIVLLLAAIAAGGAVSVPSAPVRAQSPSAPSTAPNTAPKQANISDAKLDAAAAAAKRVAALSDKYEQQLAQAPEDQKEGVVREANDALTKAVTDQGLSVEEFSTIMEVAKSDPEVREKIVKRIK
jgi:hypothetical protein